MASTIVAALIEHRKKNLRSARSELPKEVGDLVYTNPLAFLVGTAFDRGMRWQDAWEIPYWIDRKGELNPSRLAEMTEPDLERLLESLPVKPRYGCKQGAKTLQSAALLVMEFGGDAAAIWENASPAQVERRLTGGIHGVGQGIAAMVIRILRDDWGMFRGQEREIDVKPDVHVMRVFRRTGLALSGDSEGAIVRIAQQLNPDFPGELDWPAWDIGQNWCVAQAPKCNTCPLTAVCPKYIQAGAAAVRDA